MILFKLPHHITAPIHFKRFKSDKSLKNYVNRVQGDSFVSQRKTSLYKSRAAFKLEEIDDKLHIFKNGTRNIVDLGFAPGAWTQVAVNRLESKNLPYNILGVDINPASPVRGCHYIQGDVTKKSTQTKILEFFKRCDVLDKITFEEDEYKHIDLVMSDMMVNTTGSSVNDHYGSIYLCNAALHLAFHQLKPGKDFVVKIFNGSELDSFQARLKLMFAQVHAVKPRASKDVSSELYLVGRKKYDMKEKGITIEQLFG
ncbi:hypothetical protein CTRG_05839 [Candida tropicalis MYA-3404]|uniref:rRNA methyltransferase 2, mitochondrial n=1 Tax=Candida tropicalis (strain ATCC MYA-3404 / T1) TaxID=294747 RepID=C5MIE6_CANTT|nr:hypothetical protein CTRG_05839 [Candida tropicalis MYA-3404]EER30440.1 hypothetical protein CTRG_05839 [Candida tropicalis MYA-3404]KAG4406302.1 hypothetical protein JTP64_003686 [Candida tropicalis]